MRHTEEILRLLRKQVSNVHEVDDIEATAREVAGKWVDPLSGGKEEINGLIYGLVQSGKTGVLTATAAIGADEGYKTIVILTSDNDPLYEQTLGRAREAFPGMDVLGKADLKDQASFLARVKGATCAIVVTKNSALLGTLVENLKAGRVKGLTCLLIDDEADQASLNTQARNATRPPSPINAKITELRAFFDKNTYLQVTATPQALFLQQPGHAFRPRFTVLSHPGGDYVGGNHFFSPGSNLVREFDQQDILRLAPGAQPTPTRTIPPSLLAALDSFMIAATFKHWRDAEQRSAFLCHVSTKTADHRHIADLLQKYKADLATDLNKNSLSLLKRMKAAYDDLAGTHKELAKANFVDLLKEVKFLTPGINIKLVNGETDEDVALHSPCNLFVGGNKLGRGVTIKNLLVSYYGRHPRSPQADTVLQHARMYGYRKKDLGLLRLFLTPQLHKVFRAIHSMEISLRDLISNQPSEEFRGIYVEAGLQPTRRSVLPGSIGVYTAGSSYNPAQVLRTKAVARTTAQIDKLLSKISDGDHLELPISSLKELLHLTVPDPSEAENVWDADALAGSLDQFAKVFSIRTGYVYVDRNRRLKGPRHETQGILTGGEVRGIPEDKPTLFMLRITSANGEADAWWPQLRFPSGGYAFAFSI